MFNLLKIRVKEMGKSFFNVVLGNLCLIFLLNNCSQNLRKDMFNNEVKPPLSNKDFQYEKIIDQQIQNQQNKKAFNINIKIEENIYPVEIIEDMKVGALVNKLQNLYNKTITNLFFASSDEYGLLDNNFQIKNYNIKLGDQLEAMTNGNMKRTTHLVNTNDPQIDIANYQGKRIPVKSYHVSCRSYKPKKYMGDENLGGVVLYSYDDKYDWYINDVHCKTGYIIVKRTSDVEQLNAQDGSMIHGNVYKSVFGVDPDKKIVGSGFAYKNGKWKYNSWSFNAKNDTFHTSEKIMNPLEIKYVDMAMKNWIENGQQNLIVKENLEILEVDKIKVL